MISDQTDQQRKDDETLLLCAGTIGAALERHFPELEGDERNAALLKGVAAMIRAGIYAEDGKLYAPPKPEIEGPPAHPQDNA